MNMHIVNSGRFRAGMFFLFLLLLLIAPGLQSQARADAMAPGRQMARQKTDQPRAWITSDHSRHAILQQSFKTGADISNACLSCHNEADAQFKETIHWTWKADDDGTGKVAGKAGDSLNNFCISTNRMKDKKCLSCHPGWQEEAKDINCLVCHGGKTINWQEAFEDYTAFLAEGDAESLEMADDIQSDIRSAVTQVILPERKNCGSCHFFGGGGDGVKHGDLDSSMTTPDKTLDVHMAADGQNFTCTRCHTTVQHHIAGRVYSKPAAKSRESLIENDLVAKITCESCHSGAPHASGSKLNDHTDKVACQSCHIPEFARVLPTKMWWDWSKAGRKEDGKECSIKDDFGKEAYLTKKGEMKWAKNVRPEYFWYNGSIETMTVRDVIDPKGVVAVSRPMGNMNEANARIYPFKVHTGKQPYDKVHNRFLAPILSGKEGYWTTYDWNDAFIKGMAAFDLPYSGEYDFVETTYVFPITHMVAPKDKSVGCRECHIQENGRLAALSGFYMPGRDNSRIVAMFGWIAVFGSLAGVTLHALGRVITKIRRKD